MRQSLLRRVFQRHVANACPEAVECVPSLMLSCIREEKQ